MRATFATTVAQRSTSLSNTNAAPVVATARARSRRRSSTPTPTLSEVMRDVDDDQSRIGDCHLRAICVRPHALAQHPWLLYEEVSKWEIYRTTISLQTDCENVVINQFSIQNIAFG